MKVAIVHDWLATYAGSERALEQIVKLYPDADIFSLVDFLKDGERGFILDKSVKTSFIQNLPFAKKKFRNYLALMPYAVERFDLSSYDLIISSCHAVSKGVKTRRDQVHICYCYTPIRYAWDLHDQYLEESGLDKGLKGILARALLEYIRRWDLKASKGVGHFVAISDYIKERISRVYDRESVVIYPPVDIERSELYENKEDFYLAASRMVPYKKMDMIVGAFNQMSEKKLVVIGDGPGYKKIERMAADNVRILGYQPTDVLIDHMKRAKAFVFAAEEDFGIVNVEAQSYGTPVIAFSKGGSRETVIDGVTGLFFDEQTEKSLIEAVKRFEIVVNGFDCKRVRENSLRFSNERFRSEFRDFVDGILKNNDDKPIK